MGVDSDQATHAPDCARPDPRILEKNGRLYCHTCRRYLDVQPDKRDAESREEDRR